VTPQGISQIQPFPPGAVTQSRRSAVAHVAAATRLPGQRLHRGQGIWLETWIIVIVVGGPNDLGPLVHSQSSQVEFDMFDFKLQECNWNHSAIITHSILYIYIGIPNFIQKTSKR
jgi:hypothetical protein